MSHPILYVLIGSFLSVVAMSSTHADEQTGQWIVKDGQPMATIVISSQPTRSVKVAVAELQRQVQAISGATLNIADKPVPGQVAIYVGQSTFTNQLGLDTVDLLDGAFVMRSGENWLALLGRDDDFIPWEPYAKNRDQLPAALEKWQEMLGGELWGNPVIGKQIRLYSKELDLWSLDQMGSFNAVCQFLRDLGMEWYMPGPLGQITPKLRDIALPRVDVTRRPEFGVRYQHVSFFALAPAEEILWTRRLGLNAGSHDMPFILTLSHGMGEVVEPKKMQEEHPDYYAIWGGRRMVEPMDPKPCLSSEGLFEQHVKYVRAMFDIYDLPMVSIMPVDGYASVCQCDQCKDKGTPERGWSGAMSDYVWGYMNRVAQEVYKTHPDKKVQCFAYTTYALPPTKIEKLSPNLVVGMIEVRRNFGDPKVRQQYLEMRKAWQAISTDPRSFTWVHYPFTEKGRSHYGVPHYFPHVIAEDLRSHSGKSYGELAEVMFDRKNGMGLHEPAFNHLNSFVTARYYWDTKQDIDAFLGKYYVDFYGPAAGEMKAFIEYCESHTSTLTADPQVMAQVLHLIEAAQAKAPEDSVYRQRIDPLLSFLEPYRQLHAQLAAGREPQRTVKALNARVLRVTPDQAGIKIDGKFDEPLWQAHKGNYPLTLTTDGQNPVAKTMTRMLWQDNAWYLAIRCQEPDMANLSIGSTKEDDTSIWYGDTIELLVETPSNAYYQITINPNGIITDLNRKTGRDTAWDSLAEVGVDHGEDYWALEIRLPIADAQAGEQDPMHQIVGDHPTPLHPWYINICRTRIRGEQREHSALITTGSQSFHERLKFAKLLSPK